jgi:hypothetical protein
MLTNRELNSMQKTHATAYASVSIFGRKRLFSMINELPTVYEVVSGKVQMKDRSGFDSTSKSRNSVKVNYEPHLYADYKEYEKVCHFQVPASESFLGKS